MKSETKSKVTGARPKTRPENTQENPNPNNGRERPTPIRHLSDQDDDLKEELGKRNKKRNQLKITEAKRTEQARKSVQRLKHVVDEIIGRQSSQLKKRAANRQRNATPNPQGGANRTELPETRIEKPKLKIPSLVEGESSDTCDSDGFIESDSDSIPPVNW